MYIQIRMHKYLIYKVITLIEASNKMTLIHDHLIDLIWYDWSIHFHNCI